MKKNKTPNFSSRKHMAVDNLYSGKALVSDYAIDKKTGKKYQPSYMKAANMVYQDAKLNPASSPRPDFKAAVNKDTKKKKRTKLGRNTHKAAQGLLQRPTRKSQY